jgi:hypothetical protein
MSRDHGAIAGVGAADTAREPAGLASSSARLMGAAARSIVRNGT